MTILAKREMDILSLLISKYIATAAPISSGCIASEFGLGLSPATIRNVLAKLGDMGLLVQPHTSAGRVPTAAGFRYYVNTILGHHELSKEEEAIITKQFNLHPENMRDILKRTGRILSLISNYAGLIVMPKSEQTIFKHMEFLPLSTGKVLGIFVSRDGTVHNRIIDVGEDCSYPDFEKITSYCNSAYHGYSLEDACRKAEKEFAEERSRYDKIIGRALAWSKEIFANVSSEELFVQGEEKLMSAPEFSDVETLKQIMDALEEKNQIVHLLSRATQSSEVSVFIGSESNYEAVENCSIVTASYKKGKEVIGMLGVIGPTRMDYSHIIPTVDFTAKLVSSMLEV
jgi:heat-inducible transcriptional repressor